MDALLLILYFCWLMNVHATVVPLKINFPVLLEPFSFYYIHG